MALNLIEAWDVNLSQVFVKFEPTIKVSTIINSNITLETNEATPQVVSSDPFSPIDISQDYNGISKTLTLTWKEGVLDPNTSYRIKFANFKTVTNDTVPTDYIDFSTSDDINPDPDDVPIELPDVQIIDYSLIPDVLHISTIADEDDEDNANASFKVIETDPLNGDYYLETDYGYGRVIVKFNKRPSLTAISSEYIKVQRKKIQRRPSRWESLDVVLSLDSARPWLYIDFPSTDATPVYNEENVVYFDENYKYRVIISKDFGTP